MDCGRRGQGPYRHFMLKEIFEQPRALADTLYGRVANRRVLPESLGPARGRAAAESRARAHRRVRHELPRGQRRRGTGSSRSRGCRARSRSRANTATAASSCRPARCSSRISQSGETADTLAALRMAKKAGYVGSLAICNVRAQLDGARVRARDDDAARARRSASRSRRRSRRSCCRSLLVTLMLGGIAALDARSARRELIAASSRHAAGRGRASAAARTTCSSCSPSDFAEKQHALFLGRGAMYPIAMEGALKLKEISYIHAEAYAGGRAQARAARAGRRRHAGDRGRAEQRAAREAQVEPAGSARARRRALSCSPIARAGIECRARRDVIPMPRT